MARFVSERRVREPHYHYGELVGGSRPVVFTRGEAMALRWTGMAMLVDDGMGHEVYVGPTEAHYSRTPDDPVVVAEEALAELLEYEARLLAAAVPRRRRPPPRS